MSTPFYITTPIYYVNDRPHIGHAYTTILADVLARYHRLMGHDTWFLTGTDEHGQKVQQAAQKAGHSPQEQADTTVVRFQELWKRLGITHDDFIRTTEPRHKAVVQGMLQDLYDRGEIYPAEYDGWYCVGDERYFAEKDLVEGNCPACGRPVQRIRESNYFFRMSRYQEWLIGHIESHPEFIQPDFRRNETLGFLRKPLQDLCISRPKSRLPWGIDLPFDDKYVCYVWFDALVNYISAVGYRSDEQNFARRWPAQVQLIGKDILTTHTVYWPTMLHACGVPLPQTIFAHGWWLIGQTKMSKSLGNVVNPMDMIDRYGVDAFRYFLMAEMTLGQDASFSEEAFIRRFNADLANDLGNLLSRVVSMIHRYHGGRMPAPSAHAGAQPEIAELRAAVAAAADRLERGLPSFHLDAALGAIIAAVREGNRFLEVRAPWTQAKLSDRQPLSDTLYAAAECLRAVSALLAPVMPAKMTELRAALGLKEEPGMTEAKETNRLTPGTEVPPLGAPLFPRIQPLDEKAPAPSKPGIPAAAPEAPTAAAPAPKAAKSGRVTPAPVAELPYDDFARIDLRAARVLAAERVEGADKLLKLQVDAGDGPRQIVAGIAKHYTPESLVGRTIVVVANLAPAKIRGVESRGMLLCASTEETLRVLMVDGGEIAPGARVK